MNNSVNDQLQRGDEWERAFRQMVRGVVYDHLMGKLAPTLGAMEETLDKIDAGFAEIARTV
jgi:hypothetical protein